MNPISQITQGIFAPSCLLEFISSLLAALFCIGLLIISTRLNAATRRMRNEYIRQAAASPQNSLTNFFTLIFISICCFAGALYMGNERASALKSGVAEYTKHRIHHVVTKGTAEFEQRLDSLLIGEVLLIGFAIIGIALGFKKLYE